MTQESITIFIDLDTVLLATHPGKYGPEIGVQSGIPEALDRLREVADRVVVVADPQKKAEGRVMETGHRVDVLVQSLGDSADLVEIVTCPHEADGVCDCAKPGSGLINLALVGHGRPEHHGWYIGGDQEGVVGGRGAGLSTIRVGPVGPASEDHLSSVHRPDYEARDLMDAANRVMLEVLATD